MLRGCFEGAVVLPERITVTLQSVLPRIGTEVAWLEAPE